MTSKIITWEGQVARMGERRVAYRVLVGKPEREGPLGRPRLTRGSGIEIDLNKSVERAWTGLNWLRIGTGGGLLCTR
jgi:hypothetical protein